METDWDSYWYVHLILEIREQNELTDMICYLLGWAWMTIAMLAKGLSHILYLIVKRLKNYNRDSDYISVFYVVFLVPVYVPVTKVHVCTFCSYKKVLWSYFFKFCVQSYCGAALDISLRYKHIWRWPQNTYRWMNEWSLTLFSDK